MRRPDPIVVIGAGFAGLATAFHLARRGVREVLVLEREAVPGAHASGRNAGLLRQVVEEGPFGPLCRAGARALQDAATCRRTGSLLLFDEPDRARLEASAAAARAEGVEARPIGPAEARRLAPLLRGARLDGAVPTPSAGVVDVHALLLYYLEGLRRGGGRLRTSCPVVEIERRADRVVAVRTPTERIEASRIVDATGAWAGRLVPSPLPLAAWRRHLFLTGPSGRSDSARPWVWDESVPYYVRPEAGRWLVSACDEDPHPAAPSPGVDPSAAERLAVRLLARLPAARRFSIERSWACLRTFAADRAPIVGPDPAIEGLFWVGGLGGHGVTASDAVGELAASRILGDAHDETLARAVSPERSAPGPTGGIAGGFPCPGEGNPST